jgi:hypothetical protein
MGAGHLEVAGIFGLDEAGPCGVVGGAYPRPDEPTVVPVSGGELVGRERHRAPEDAAELGAAGLASTAEHGHGRVEECCCNGIGRSEFSDDLSYCVLAGIALALVRCGPVANVPPELVEDPLDIALIELTPSVEVRPPSRPPAERGSTESKADRQADATPATAEKFETDSASLPDWVHREPARSDDPYYVVASSGEYSSDAFARDEMLSAQMVNAADRYIREVMRRPAAVADAVKFDPAYLRSTYVDAQYPPAGSAAGEKTFVRLKFDSRFRDEVDHRWRQFVSSERLERLSGYSAVGLALLGVVYIYLRATSSKQAS